MPTTLEQYRQLIIDQPVIPAPMCGISDFAYRAICREFAGPFAFTQMAASEGIARNDVKTLAIYDLHGDRPEPLIGMQLFGCDPRKLGDSARRLQDLGATVVDLNMGCPAKKVTGANGGSALLRQPDLVRRIFAEMRAALGVPFTVKMRWDWDEEGAALAIGHIAQEEGLDGLCLHARTREEGYSGEADWDRIRRLKESVSIPVLGNGDVRSADDAEEMVDRTGCDGVMIGRGSIGDPWLLGRALRRLRPRAAGGATEPAEAAEPGAPAWAERREVMLRHARLMAETKGRRGLVEFRKHAAAYLRGVRGGKRLRVSLMKVEDLAGLAELLRNPPAFDDDPGEGARDEARAGDSGGGGREN